MGINMNTAGFSQQVGNFDAAMNDYRITPDTEYLNNCTGQAILDINSAISKYDVMIGNINSLYTATSGYLHKVNYNISLCEEDNTLND